MENIVKRVSSAWPKKNIIVFNSFPDVSGNALALYEYILKNRMDISNKYKLIWTVGAKNVDKSAEFLRVRTGISHHKVVEKKSIEGILSFFSARYLISTHGYFPRIGTSRNQTHINLWHGMPFKKIGQDVDHISGKKDTADYTIATSLAFKKIMAHAFSISEDRVIVSGQPCNDTFFSGKDVLSAFGIPHNYEKIIMWMPTYRKSVVGDIRVDGNENAFGVSDVLGNHFNEIDMCLKKQNYLLLIKPHPMDVLCRTFLPESNNIKVILNSDLETKNILLYELLGNCDVLWTDYSSVFIDYLIVNKPIAFVCNDIDEYAKTRGFFFEPALEYMPGELVTNYDELIKYLNNMDVINKKWENKRKGITQIFNSFCDSSASERVCDIFWK